MNGTAQLRAHNRQPQTSHGENREWKSREHKINFFIRTHSQSRRLSLIDSYVRLVRFLNSLRISHSEISCLLFLSTSSPISFEMQWYCTFFLFVFIPWDNQIPWIWIDTKRQNDVKKSKEFWDQIEIYIFYRSKLISNVGNQDLKWRNYVGEQMSTIDLRKSDFLLFNPLHPHFSIQARSGFFPINHKSNWNFHMEESFHNVVRWRVLECRKKQSWIVFFFSSIHSFFTFFLVEHKKVF